jgi:hypothetical protein
MNDYHELIDTSVIAPAEEAHERAGARLQDARKRLSVEEAAHRDAERAARRAEELGGDEAFPCDEALANAQRRLDVATRIVASATEAQRQTQVGIDTARAEAYRPVAAAGFRALLAASERHDAALKEMEAAEADRLAAGALVMAAHAQGFQAQQVWSNCHGHIMVPAELRRRYMAGSRVNPDTGDLR